VLSCTPTTEDNDTWLAFEDSNQQEDFIPCPKCGEYQFWKFGRLKLPETLRDPEEIIKKNDCWYECEHCDNKILEYEKPSLIKQGIWCPKGQIVSPDGILLGEPERPKRRSGFHIPGLLSPAPDMSWARMLSRFFRAQQPSANRQKLMMTFRNNDEGLPYKMKGRHLNIEDVKKLAGGYKQGTVPQGVIILVAGADYHESLTTGTTRIRWGIRGFTPGCLKSYLIDSGEVASSSSERAFDELDELLFAREFPVEGGDMKLSVACELIDSGYQGKRPYHNEEDEDPQADKIYDYARRRPHICFPTKGLVGPCPNPLKSQDLERATERRLNARQRLRYKGMILLEIDTFYFKNQVTGWAVPTADEDGVVLEPAKLQFYSGTPLYYIREFCNEQLIKNVDGKGNVSYKWERVTPGAQAHSLDVEVLMAAAAFYKGIQYMKTGAANPAAVRRVGKIQR
jgi:phage terminase large subunit GpA-like protein